MPNFERKTKDPVLLNGMLSNFQTGRKYTRAEALKKMKKLQQTMHLFKGVSLDNKRLVHYLRRFFEVEIVEENGRKTSYRIVSRNVTGFELDILKIRRMQ